MNTTLREVRAGDRDRRRSFLGRWPAFKLAVLWCAIVVVFTWYGLAYSREAAILFGGLGVGVATCFVVGFGLLSLVHTRCVGKIEAIVLLALSSVVSPILAVVSTETVANLMGIERSEAGLGIGIIGMWLLTIAGGTFLMFTPIVIGIGNPPRQPEQ